MKIGEISGAGRLSEMFGGNQSVSNAGHLCSVCRKPLGDAVVKTVKGDTHSTCVEVRDDGRIVLLPSQSGRPQEPDRNEREYWDRYLEQCRKQRRKQLQELLKRQNEELLQQQISGQFCPS